MLGKAPFFIFLTSLVFLAAAPCAAEAGSDNPELCQIAHDALGVASQIRGLSIKQPVECIVQGRDAVLEFLKLELNKQSSELELLAESELYKAFGLLPRDFDYKVGLLQLYSAQLGGYYDPHRHRYVLASWLAPAFQRGVAVHELTHALQDQHFSLDEFLPASKFTTDETMARQALAEGDASAVMLDDLARTRGGEPLARQQDLTIYLLQQLLSSMFTAAVYQAPSSLQAMLIFPYMSGVSFVQRLLRIDGYAGVDRAYKRPPRTTAEILHPELYCLDKACQPLQPAKVTEWKLFWKRQTADYQEKLHDRLGEFLCGLLADGGRLGAGGRLRDGGRLGNAGELTNVSGKNTGRGRCQGWRGDSFVLLTKKDSPSMLSFIVKFSSTALAEDYSSRMLMLFSSAAKDRVVSRQGNLVGILISINTLP